MADNSFIDAFKLSLSNIKGTVSLAVYHKFNNFLTLYTNNRSLYLLTNNSGISIFRLWKIYFGKFTIKFIHAI